MRSTILATAALLAFAGPAFSQSATGGGNAPAPSTTTSTPPVAPPATTPGSMGTGTTAGDKAGVGANLPNAVQQQTPDASSAAPAVRR